MIHCITFLLCKCDLQDSSLLGKVHLGLLKLLMLNTDRGSSSVFVPRSSKDSRYLSFLNFVSFENAAAYFGSFQAFSYILFVFYSY
jgi:hypothetical protein